MRDSQRLMPVFGRRNLLIVVTPYFNYRLAGTAFSGTASSWVPLIYTIGNFGFLVYATWSLQNRQSQAQAESARRRQRREKRLANGANLSAISTQSVERQGASPESFVSLEKRIFGSINSLALVIIVLWLTTRIEAFNGTLFFSVMILLSITSSCICAIIQSSTAALASLFEDPLYLQGVMSGQGLIGFAVSFTQFLAAWNSSRSGPAARDVESDGESSPESLINATSNFFLIALLFTAFAAITALVLIKFLPIYRAIKSNAIQLHPHAANSTQSLEASIVLSDTGSADETEDDSVVVPSTSPWAQLLVVDRKIRDLGWAVFTIFVVTIGLFPGITSSIVAVNPSWPISSALLWIPFGFVVYNTGDWLGRALPGFPALVFTEKKSLVLASVSRFLFVPLVLLCNVQVNQGSPQRVPFINSDIIYLLVMLLFAISNGYLTSLLMMRAMTEPALEPQEVDIASSIMLIYLTAGLLGGALLSFVLRAIVM